ncbi:MAG TPA: MFS transporter [Rhizomicrobium sp.]|nr:MFS transporter [Rhizomicrobium sp.]
MPQADGRKNYALGAALIVAMFAIWGLSHRLYDTILPGFVSALSLSEFQVSLAHWVRTFGYILIAIPSAFFLRAFGYKAGVVGGLGCFAVAMFMFYPAETQHSYVFFLIAGLIANCGVALLEIAADPWVMRIGRPETAIRRLNFAQTLNPVGLLIGMVLGAQFISADGHFGKFPIQPYIVIGAGVLLFAYLIDNVKFSPEATERAPKEERTLDTIKEIFAKADFRFGLAALALYIAGHTVLWGFAVQYGESVLPGVGGVAGIAVWTLYAFIAGRIAGTALMYVIDPVRLMVAFAALATALTGAAAFVHGWPGIYCVVSASFFMSILFPTIFGVAARDVGKNLKSASALLIMASGSANVVPPTIALILGTGFSPYVVLLPSLCFAVITVYALKSRGPAVKSASVAAAPHVPVAGA